MYDIVVGTLVFILRAINYALDVARFFTDANKLARLATSSDKIIKIPSDPRPLPPAAQRALAEAEERELKQAEGGQAASGTVQAS
jgi:hypothetical protein